MIKLHFNIALLKAANLATAKDYDPFLKGVYVNLADLSLQATNRYIAFISKPESLSLIEGERKGGFVLPSELVKQILSVKIDKKISEEHTLYLEFDPDSQEITATIKSMTLKSQATQERFPSIANVYVITPLLLQSDGNIQVCYYTPYLKILDNMLKALSIIPTIGADKGVRLHFGENKTIAEFPDNIAQLVIMGMQDNETPNNWQYQLTK
ncbi:hypothetical protein [Lonepinella koalarum]|uniref:Uncharacterized protein n=1 Tax=Lonepinella koalarum TaxID=53417 RepID=A0A4R1KQ79_9PAST|nr:hypothetical protein [Lonepinella koalarum]MDH2925587.1 hypothetical protein [Lonepinella koalarum]MDH2925600.1 hypothetical protein [Lonepinella koalarum]MDH2927283.1 hypothetical protein [Lonepinella koalarum]MDH2927307.1 hypothetical protein [Lonepinella koalarum]TCK67206.1 hypothetical protein EV692_2116 [Lonepinella koalarum]